MRIGFHVERHGVLLHGRLDLAPCLNLEQTGFYHAGFKNCYGFNMRNIGLSISHLFFHQRKYFSRRRKIISTTKSN